LVLATQLMQHWLLRLLHSRLRQWLLLGLH
jgi:hypothetical protein